MVRIGVTLRGATFARRFATVIRIGIVNSDCRRSGFRKLSEWGSRHAKVSPPNIDHFGCCNLNLANLRFCSSVDNHSDSPGSAGSIARA
ncbi:hypothetical protein BofuT4_P079750.1 [Botrytis cinerea T4]|uniref:Uncharacterized protein n=1 Tax=Botryotinia fuckeliana (strain T4) TaxID=999810 RepID=G2YKN2_BOTF4|nr:hypothetical protein BofuT4_P079750.1 [Botrytis cinerea T4]